MSEGISLEAAERRAFRITHNDGLWDIFIGCFLSMFAIAPHLSVKLGDFWSSAVFLPVWAVLYLIIRQVRKRVVHPRVGVVTFGPGRKAKLRRFSVVMFIIYVLAFMLGLVAAMSVGRIPGIMTTIVFGMIFLLTFSLAAYFLDFSRLYLYGLMGATAPLIGEWLWQRGYASHHGYPVTFGTIAVIMIVTGVVIFVRLLRDNPLPSEEILPEER